ncbi:uncharacterized membrane protein YsdA (DUF1294 family) [Dysgonomonas alginatilytica]|uniref:Uncharacterized membrane protein YsdA (DUF1294 family) n=1 Tax=Dysgonomonas alginatilytica TaxID=1605892 RepID=A0A2V3PXF0_9BACT|nr:DUF1294 domain-containing protein [Dysgonomonas alginatilytica]PXV65515.1 uncharacterized membrane protein YsdA (DUF1294 family) [Dysgonomonas alginatilytica]
MYIFYFLIIWNIVVFFLYGLDKRKAKTNKYRISEKTLLLSSFLWGATGAFLGMHVFRHKTKHAKFKILIPIFLVLNCVCFYYLRGYLLIKL